jgi:predicted TIM-barrel fold metal-dependent hydrolase
MIIDTETHLFLRAWPLEADPDGPRYEHHRWHAHDGDLLVSEMDRAGVDLAFVISYDGYDFGPFMERHGSSPSDFYGGEAYARTFVERHPDRLVWFPTLRDPRQPAAVRRLEEQLAAGAVGVKFFPAYLGLSIGDGALGAVYDLLESSGRCLMIGLEDTSRVVVELDAAVRTFGARPGLRVQFNHGANAVLTEDDQRRAVAELVSATESVFISTSVLGGTLMEWTDGTEYPFRGWLSRLERLLDAAGPDRVSWGTDWPWFEYLGKYPQFLDAVRLHADFLNAEERVAYLGGNAERYLKGAARAK